MKRQILSALAIGSMLTATTALSPAPANANASCATIAQGNAHKIDWFDASDFKSWEHPFYCDRDICKMSQTNANTYCRTILPIYAMAAGIQGRTIPTARVWAHVWDGLCIYND